MPSFLKKASKGRAVNPFSPLSQQKCRTLRDLLAQGIYDTDSPDKQCVALV